MRMFLALDINESTRLELAQLKNLLTKQIKGCKANWVTPENLHVTLKFLGEVDGSTISNVCTAVDEVARQFKPIEFDVKGLAALPDRGPLRMFWADATEPTGQMAKLFDEIELALQPLRFDRERRAFRPHITIARINRIPDLPSARQAVAKLTEKEFGRVQANCVTIYTSTLTRQGPIYTPMAKPKFSPETSAGSRSSFTCS